MRTYKEVYSAALLRLKDAGIYEYESNVSILFEHTFGIDKLRLLTYGGDAAPEDKCMEFEKAIESRLENVPVQYITGKAYFYGREFSVDENVLIPRFDTEVLVYEAIKYIKSLGGNIKALDVCTGSGCIAITLAKECNCSCHALDISMGALNVAKKNATDNEADVTFIQSDMFAKVSEQYDIIVSNPPYITNAEIEKLLDEVKSYEPRLALSGGDDGLVFYRILADESGTHLKDGGKLMLEIGYDQGDAVSNLLNVAGFKDVHVVKDLAGLDRVVIGTK